MFEDPFSHKIPSDDDIFDSSADELTEKEEDSEEEDQKDFERTPISPLSRATHPTSRKGKGKGTKPKTASASSTPTGKSAKTSSPAQQDTPRLTTLRQAGTLKFATSSPGTSTGAQSSKASTKAPVHLSTTAIPETLSSTEEDDTGHLTDKYAPKDITEVAVHPGKIKDVREWLEKHTSYSYNSERGGSILLLTGPAGSGKTTLLKILAKELDIEIVEWVNTINPNTLIQRPKVPGESYSRAQTIDEEYVPVMEAFQKFFARASRFDPLALDSNTSMGTPSSQHALTPRRRRTRKNIMLLEDFPPISAYTSRQIFQETITRFIRTERASSVLVMIISDVFSKHNTEMLFSSMDYQEPALTARTMLPKQVFDNSHQCHEIKTIMMKAIKRVVKEEFNTSALRPYRPTDDELDQLYSLHNGDIRAMLNSLQFHCILPSKKRRYHSGGDTDTRLPVHLKWMSRPPMPFNPELELIDKLPVEPDLFGLMLHQNYPHHQNSIGECSIAAEYLSVSDLFSQRAGLENTHMTPYSTSIAIRGVLVAPKGPGRMPQDRKQWWPELLGINRTKRENEQIYNDFAACLSGETAEGYATGFINGPGALPKSLIRHEIGPVLAVMYKVDPYHPFFQRFPQGKRQFLKSEVGMYGMGKGIQKRKVGEHDTGLEDQVTEAALASSQTGAEQTGRVASAVPEATGSAGSIRSNYTGGTFASSMQPKAKSFNFTSTMMVGEEDPIEDFSD
ncbi:Cell cycle checkpoint protein rad17 [Actinomortierella wolfii]|nr:Cell cycle checkpoint protein rad17 [Actinomortierella wolfii]